jgi:methionine-rich copper-binding protein CopC
VELARAGLERVLLLLFGAVQSLFLFQALAFGAAGWAARAAAPPETPAWLRDAMLSALLLSGTFLAAGLFLIPLRRWRLPPASGHGEPGAWPALLGISLLALPALAAHGASGLVPLWREIGVWLGGVGFWDGLSRPDASGLVMLPILLALCVPALVTAAAVFSVACPIALLPLLPTRSRLFPALLASGAVCQAALLLGGWLAADAFARLAGQGIAAMAGAEDAEVTAVADGLRWAAGVLTSTSTALFVPLFGVLGWLGFLRVSGAAAAFFTQGEGPVAAAPPRAARAEPTREGLAPAGTTGRAGWSAAHPPRTRRAQRALAALGALLLAFGAADRLRTRPSFASSEPAPGAMLEAPPTLVRVSFGAALDPASSLSITRLVLPPHTGEQPEEVEIADRIAPTDPERRTLEAAPPRLRSGLYRVSWHALPAAGGVPRHGSFSFGIGVPVPADAAGAVHSLRDRDSGSRGRSRTLAGGTLLLALGLLPLRRLS